MFMTPYMAQCVEKPSGYHGPLGSPMAKKRGAAGPKGSWSQDFPMDSIHNDTPKDFPNTFILSSSRTSKEVFLSGNGHPREYHGQCLYRKVQTLIELNPNILVQM